MTETTSGAWKMWTGTKQEVLDLIAANENLIAIRSFSANNQADSMCVVVRFIDV